MLSSNSTINKMKSLISGHKVHRCHSLKAHKYHHLPKVWTKAISVSLTRYQTMIVTLLKILQSKLTIKSCSNFQKKAVWTRSDIIKSDYKILRVSDWSETNPRIRLTTRFTNQVWVKTVILSTRISTRFPTTATTASKPVRWRNVAGLLPSKKPSDKERPQKKSNDAMKSRCRPLSRNEKSICKKWKKGRPERLWDSKLNTNSN